MSSDNLEHYSKSNTPLIEFVVDLLYNLLYDFSTCCGLLVDLLWICSTTFGLVVDLLWIFDCPGSGYT